MNVRETPLTLAGWFVVGPMLSVCADHAPTAHDAKREALRCGSDQAVAVVLPLYRGSPDLEGETYTCCVDDEPLTI